MANKKHVPHIRFKGFDGEWAERQLNDIVDIVSGGTPSTSNPDYWDGEIDWYSPSEIGDCVYTSGSVKKITALGLEKSSAKILPAEKTVLFTSRAGIGDMAILKDAGATNQGFQSFVLKEEINIYFLYSMGFLIKKHAMTKASGSTFLEISSKALGDMLILIPEKSEQAAIGNFFRNLDNLITLRQRKYDKLVMLKKSMLNKMFPKEGANVPEIRFAGFDGNWELRRWSDTVEISTNMVDPKIGTYDDLPHVGPGNIESFTGRLMDNVNTVREDKLISGKFYFHQNDIIYGKINPQLGKYAYVSFEGLASADAYVLNAKNGLSQTFLFVLLQTQPFFDYSVSVSMRSGMPKINRNELNAYSFICPDEQEQAAIGNFFRNLDNLIAAHQQELDKLKTIKKTMLDKMFV